MPTAWMVCPECHGEGRVLNEAFRGVPLEEDLVNDAEFLDDMTSGLYDVICPCCHGKRVVEDSPAANQAREWDREAKQEIEREMRMLGEW